MSNKSFWGKLATKNKKSAYEVSKETGIPEDKVKEVLSGDRTLPTKHVNAVVKSIQRKDTSGDLDYLNAKKFFEGEDFLSLRNRFGYGTQRSLANALKVPSCYISSLENGKFSVVPKSVLVKAYDFFQDDLNINVKPIVAKKGGRKKQSKSIINTSMYATSVNYCEVKDSKGYSIPKNFNANELFDVLLSCEMKSVITLYKLMNKYISNDK